MGLVIWLEISSPVGACLKMVSSVQLPDTLATGRWMIAICQNRRGRVWQPLLISQVNYFTNGVAESLAIN